MRTRRRLLTTTIAMLTVPFAVAAAASAAAASPVMKTTPAAHVATSTSAQIITTEQTKFGKVLETAAGESLYVFSGDNFPFSATGLQLDCTALNVAGNGTPCTTAWPPVVATGGQLVGEGGVKSADLGTVTRNGVTQVTYFGKPLYGFIADTAAHDVNGEEIGAFNGEWFLQRTDGRPSVETPTISEEVSPNGIILSSAIANGGRTLYLLTSDSPKTSNCNAAGGCDALWPPLLTNSHAMAGNGVARGLIGTIRRSDGTNQVTYAGHPLYFFALDLAAGAANGEINGQHILDPAPVNGVWYSVLPNGTPEPGSATIQSESSNGTNILADAGSVNGVIATLYAFSADTATQSNCNGACAVAWPPVLTQTAPSAIDSASGSLLGVIQRADGTFQVTYNGHPLYYFAFALDSGTEGNGISVDGGTFNIVNVSGAVG
jgi:predicted lipoprotein with Yx(FWY)xxD motif